MLVTSDQLAMYNIEFWFARRTGAGDPMSRDEYFIENPTKLQKGIYCAIGNDTNGWELEQYNGVNWVVAAPDESYRLVITSNGLKALANTVIGGYRLIISGVKIIDQIVKNPSIPFIEWTDEILMSHGNVKFSIGTVNAHNGPDEQGNSRLPQVLSWRYNNASGGLQYCLNLPAEGLGALSDDDEEEWDVGTIGLYVKDSDGVTDVLFAVASLPSLVRKYSNNVGKIGNRLKLYFNTVLSNLGFVSNLEVMEDSNQNLPEVPNESLLIYPKDNKRRPYNCYLIDNLYGSNMPALAVPRALNNTIYPEDSSDWAYFQPSNNFLGVKAENFASDVKSYEFVYWDSAARLYKKAEGRGFNDEIDIHSKNPNPKMPIGIRVGNNIVYSGEITNFQATYEYNVALYNGGFGYASGDELNVIATDNLVFRVKVTAADLTTGEITSIALVGPSTGNIKLEGDSYVVKSAEYANTSQLPRNGSGARFRISATEMDRYIWNFSSADLNKPVYCGKGDYAGEPITEPNDCFLGWITGNNSIRLGLDLRNEATQARFGTTRYATDSEVKYYVNYANSKNSTSVTPQALGENYIQRTKPSNSTQQGYSWGNPIEVETCIHFKQMILGRSISPASGTTDYSQQGAHFDDPNVDFWGRALRAEWGDLAEYYEADEIYQPGTLITFGAGEKEITKAQFEADGVISSKPGLQLGSKMNEYYLPVALTGRVPVMMDGNSVNYFGDKIYLSRVRPGMASTIKNGRCIGKIVDKNPGTKRLVECVVRIDFDND